MDKTINSTVLINGGETTALDTKRTNLLERELYISSDGYLYTGKAQMNAEGTITQAIASKIKAGQSDTATSVQSHKDNSGKSLFNFNQGSATIGGFNILAGSYASTGDRVYMFQSIANEEFSIHSDGSIVNPTINGGSVGNEMDPVKVNTKEIVLASNVYGSVSDMNAVKNPVKGQLFFVVY